MTKTVRYTDIDGDVEFVMRDGYVPHEKERVNVHNEGDIVLSGIALRIEHNVVKSTGFYHHDVMVLVAS